MSNPIPFYTKDPGIKFQPQSGYFAILQEMDLDEEQYDQLCADLAQAFHDQMGMPAFVNQMDYCRSPFGDYVYVAYFMPYSIVPMIH